MNDAPDPSEVIARMRRLCDKFKPHAEALREIGLDVPAFIADCEGFIAAVEGRGDPEFDVNGFSKRAKEFSEEAAQFIHLQEQAEAVQVVAEVPIVIESVQQAVADLRAHGGKSEARTAAEIEATLAAARERMARGDLPAEEFEDMALSLGTQRAEMKRRNRIRSIMAALYWEKQTPEWWAALPEKARKDLGKVVSLWQEQREELLAELPIEDRRRLESMTLEDFNQPPDPSWP